MPRKPRSDAKITPDDYRDVARRIAAEESFTSIGSDYGCNRVSVARAAKRPVVTQLVVEEQRRILQETRAQATRDASNAARQQARDLTKILSNQGMTREEAAARRPELQRYVPSAAEVAPGQFSGRGDSGRRHGRRGGARVLWKVAAALNSGYSDRSRPVEYGPSPRAVTAERAAQLAFPGGRTQDEDGGWSWKLAAPVSS